MLHDGHAKKGKKKIRGYFALIEGTTAAVSENINWLPKLWGEDEKQNTDISRSEGIGGRGSVHPDVRIGGGNRGSRGG